MRVLEFDQVVELQRRLIAQSGGNPGIKDSGLVHSALAQPLMTFGGEDLYPTIGEKAAALAFSLTRNHGFNDGNKRIGHAAMESFLILNGFEIGATVDEQESIFLRLAAGELGREEFTDWVRGHIIERGDGSPARVPEVGSGPDTPA